MTVWSLFIYFAIKVVYIPITILLVGTSELVRNSRKFAITVFVLTLVISYHFEGFLPGN